MSEFDVSRLVQNSYSRVRSQRAESVLECAQLLLAELEQQEVEIKALSASLPEEHEATQFFMIESCVILKVHHPEHDVHAHTQILRELLSTHQIELGLWLNFSAPTELSGIKKFLQAVP